MFNPASYEETGSGYGHSVAALVTFYSIGLVVTYMSLFQDDNLVFKQAMPWITMPVLVPIDLLAAFQTLYVLNHGMKLTNTVLAPVTETNSVLI